MLALTKLLGPHRLLVLAAIVSGIAHHVVVLASAGVGAWVVSQAITGASPGELRGGLVTLGLLLPLLAVTPWLESYLAHVAAFRVLADVRGRVYGAFDRLAPGYLLERRSGDLGAAAISDVEQLELWFAHTLSPLVSAATVPVAALTALGVFTRRWPSLWRRRSSCWPSYPHGCAAEPKPTAPSCAPASASSTPKPSTPSRACGS